VASRVHLWSGLITGPLFLVLGLSGAVLVFRPELEDALTGPPPVAAAAPAPSLDAVLRAALLSHPRAEARALRAPARPDRPYHVEVHHGGQRLDVAVDPSTLRVVASRAPERSVFAAVHSLHAALHGGRAGTALVGLLGLWLIVESLTGIWLYGPSVKPRRARGARARSRALHRLVGAASVAIGVVVGLTGTLLAAASALALVDAGARPPAGEGLARLDAVVARVDTASPGARIVALVADADGSVRVDVRSAAGSAGSVRVARATGEIGAARLEPVRTWDVVRRLHAGDFAGPLARVVYAIVGLALPLLSITGFVMSARRHSSKVLT
jgi:uncharacterized iron-regulated membrane protein